MSVVANVAINVDSSGAVSKLRQVNDAGSKLEKAQGLGVAVIDEQALLVLLKQNK